MVKDAMESVYSKAYGWECTGSGATATAASLNFEVLVDEIISPNYSSAVGQTALMKGDSKVGVPNLIA